MKILDNIKKPLQELKKTQQQIKQWLAFAEKIKPKGKFEQLPTPAAPDYADLQNWAAHPKVENKSHFAPEGFKSKQATAKADVFFLHPTTFFGNTTWNAPISDAASKEFVDELIMPGQASVFNAACRVFAPRYRQATFYSFLEGGTNGQQALELAYSDVLRAFDYYMKHENNGRPFFLAGHSQGTLQLMRLLEERIENSDIRQQFIAAYAIGFRFPTDKFEQAFKNLKPSQSATDTGCIIAWDTYVTYGKPGQRMERSQIWYSTADGEGKWERRSYKKPLCINPLNWTIEHGIAEKNKNKGAVNITFAPTKKAIILGGSHEPIGLKALSLSAPYEAEVSAEIRKDNFLYVSEPPHAFFRKMLLPRGNYHMYDYALFYMDMRANIVQRLEAFL